MRLLLILAMLVWGNLSFAANETTSSSQAVSPYSHVFLAVAGPIAGPGIMGHSFFIFSNSSEDPERGMAFQYSLDFTELSKKYDFKVLKPWDYASLAYEANDLPFQVERLPAKEFLSLYRQEGRTVVLFPLEISPEVVRDLYVAVQADLMKVLNGRGEEVMYNLFQSNCASFLLNRLNQVLKAHDLPEFTLAWDKSLSLKPYSLFDKTVYLNNVPLLWIQSIQKHPLAGPKIELRALTVNFARQFAEWRRCYEEFLKRAGASEDYINIYSRAFASEPMRTNKDFLRKLVSSIKNNRRNPQDPQEAKEYRFLKSLTGAIAPQSREFFREVFSTGRE